MRLRTLQGENILYILQAHAEMLSLLRKLASNFLLCLATLHLRVDYADLQIEDKKDACGMHVNSCHYILCCSDEG